MKLCYDKFMLWCMLCYEVYVMISLCYEVMLWSLCYDVMLWSDVMICYVIVSYVMMYYARRFQVMIEIILYCMFGYVTSWSMFTNIKLHGKDKLSYEIG